MTPQDMLNQMMAKLSDKTGRDFKAWVAVAKASGLDKHKAITVHMKTEHGLNHNEAQWIAWGVTDPGRIDQYDRPTDLVDALYSGKKAHLRPIYDALLAEVTALGGPQRSVVCKTYTSVARKSQFVILAPRTNSKLDLELALPADTPTDDRLQAFKTSNPKMTRRMRLGSVDEIDDHVRGALQQAWANTPA